MSERTNPSPSVSISTLSMWNRRHNGEVDVCFVVAQATKVEFFFAIVGWLWKRCLMNDDMTFF